MQITLNRRLLAGLGVAALALVGGSLLAARMLQPASAAATPPDQAAVAFVRAFYTVDYRDRAGWLAGLQPLATASGAKLIENMLAPAAWPGLTKAQTVTVADQVQVTDEGLRAEGTRAMSADAQGSPETRWQIRHLTVTIAAAGRWPGMSAEPFGANVLLVEAPNGWKFGAFLSDADVKVFAQSGRQP